MNVVYTVTPVEGENIIGYELKSQSERVGMWVANVSDKIIRKQLIALGWTPPVKIDNINPDPTYAKPPTANSDPFADIRDKRLGELNAEQTDRAFELWLRENSLSFGRYYAEGDSALFPCIFRVIDRLRKRYDELLAAYGEVCADAAKMREHAELYEFLRSWSCNTRDGMDSLFDDAGEMLSGEQLDAAIRALKEKQ